MASKVAASGKPAGNDRLKIFISYSRSDATAADAIVAALSERGFDVTIDTRDLPFGEKWQAELAEFIRLSDTVIWLVSEASIQSHWVNWELDEVARRNKRLVPLMVGLVNPAVLPRQLGEIHILPPDRVFDLARDLDTLMQVLETDHAWLKQASRLQDRAHEWITKSRASALLLSRGALNDAERWKEARPVKAPSPAPEVMDLMLASPAFSRAWGASGLRLSESASATKISAEQRRSPMPTRCSQSEMDFGSCGSRKLVGAFDGGAISSNGGVVLLAAADKRLGLGERLATCFTDHRHADLVTHSLADLLRQRIFALALGHEDLIDHDALRFDPALTAALGKPEEALAGKSTLNRLEHAGKIGLDRHHKLDHDPAAIERLLVDLFIEAHAKPPVRIVLDLDATDDPLHGEQEGRHFNGYYDCYCYLPLYIFCGRHLLAAKLRSSSVDAAEGSVDEVARIVRQIRAHWPNVSVVIRADSGFCRDDLMTWCEDNNVKYVLGLAGNSRLTRTIAPEMRKARAKAKRTGRAARVFADFTYRTRRSWSRKRRVIGKEESTQAEANPRFIVTNVHEAFGAARFLYEDVYCQRGEMENRLKECQGDLFADRTPAPTMRANQLRLWLSSLAYVLMCAVRRIGLPGTALERATCGTIRLQLLKIGALVTISVRRVKLAFASACPSREVFMLAQRRLCA